MRLGILNNDNTGLYKTTVIPNISMSLRAVQRANDNHILMAIICFLTLYPFLYLVAQSFSSEQAIMQGKVSILPVEFNVTTYKKVLEKY